MPMLPFPLAFFIPFSTFSLEARTSPNRSHRTQSNLGGDLSRSHDRQPRKNRLEPPLDVIPGRTWTKKHGEGRSGRASDKVPHRIGETPDNRSGR
jgi:hypothetical protein